MEDVGDQEKIDYLKNNVADEKKNYADLKDSVEETRVRASDHFSRKRWTDAIKLYQRILQTIEYSKIAGEDEEHDRKEYLIRIHTNLAICFNKKEEYQKTMFHISRLEAFGNIDDQPKALYTKGRALMMLGDNENALVTLLKAQRLKQADIQINAAIEELKERKNSYDAFQKNFAKNLKLY